VLGLSHVLLVEDDDGDAFLVEDLLADAAPDVATRRAVSLAEATEAVRQQPPEVVLLDLGLPDAEGSEAVARMVTAAPDAAVLVLTGLSDEHRAIEAVAAGAQDYLVKGQVDGSLLLRAMRYAVERRRVDDSLRRLVASELRAAENARLERGLLPQPWVRDPGVRIVSRYRPGRHQSLLGGDFYDVVERPDGRLHVVVGDVAGHGPDEAALGVLLRVAWRALVVADTPVERVLPLLDHVLETERYTDEMFATAVYLVVDRDRRAGTLVNAGHPAPVSLSSPPATPWPHLPGPPLGVIPLDRWPQTRVDLSRYWPLMLHTDGLIEGRAGPERLGQDGLLSVLADEVGQHGQHGGPLDLTGLPERVIDIVQKINGDALPDDVAVVIIDAGAARA
jgi:serine phosphatase RsbU (regulator of sigma subunit)